MQYLQLTMIVSFMGAAAALAAEHDRQDYPKMTVRMAGASVLAQKTCPVTGKPIRQDVFVEQDGIKVCFCCSNCPSKFKESPEKYLPAVYRQVYPQSVQVKCPVMGGSVDGKTFIQYQGRRIDFCCDGCPQAFKANPAKYLDKMKQLSTDQVHCPVTGKAINPKVSSKHEGKAVYFGSEDARTRFEAEPAKYAAALRPETGIVARGPSADEDLILYITSPGESSIHKRKDLKPAVYEGKTWFLFSDDGVRRFQANPAEYAKALEVQMKKLLAAQETPTCDTVSGAMSHQGHGQGARRMGCAGHQH